MEEMPRRFCISTRAVTDSWSAEFLRSSLSRAPAPDSWVGREWASLWLDTSLRESALGPTPHPLLYGIPNSRSSPPPSGPPPQSLFKPSSHLVTAMFWNLLWLPTSFKMQTPLPSRVQMVSKWRCRDSQGSCFFLIIGPHVNTLPHSHPHGTGKMLFPEGETQGLRAGVAC